VGGLESCKYDIILLRQKIWQETTVGKKSQMSQLLKTLTEAGLCEKRR
jgi:hypothetical protein